MSVDPRELIGLRREDLSDEEAAALEALLASDPEARAEHEGTLALGREIAEISKTSSRLSADDVLARLRARRVEAAPPEPAPPEAAAAPSDPAPPAPAPAPTMPKGASVANGFAPPPPPANRWPFIAMFVALAAAALVAVAVPQGDPVRSRGHETGPGEIRIAAVVDGTRRELTDRAVVAPGERVVFIVHTTGEGYVTLDEVGGAGRIYPPSGAWKVGPGAHALGGDAPLAWRPDAASGPLVYRASYCAAPGGDGCTTGELVLVWGQ